MFILKINERDAVFKTASFFATWVDVDFAEYCKKVDNRAVKKNCTIPYWLNVKAEKAGINFSKVLQEALLEVLGASE